MCEPRNDIGTEVVPLGTLHFFHRFFPFCLLGPRYRSCGLGRDIGTLRFALALLFFSSGLRCRLFCLGTDFGGARFLHIFLFFSTGPRHRCFCLGRDLGTARLALALRLLSSSLRDLGVGTRVTTSAHFISFAFLLLQSFGTDVVASVGSSAGQQWRRLACPLHDLARFLAPILLLSKTSILLQNDSKYLQFAQHFCVDSVSEYNMIMLQKWCKTILNAMQCDKN